MPRFAEPTEPEARLGSVVAGVYRLLRILGRGGTGIVYEAVHVEGGEEVALKMLQPIYEEDAALREIFLGRALEVAAMRHPHLIEIREAGVDDQGLAYVVLERLRGISLGHALEEHVELSVEAALAALLPITEALARVHERGLVHGDLKPENVFLHGAPSGVVPKLFDFGLFHRVRSSSQLGGFGGTLLYAAPERVDRSGPPGPESDIWSVGVMLFECLTGEVPFPIADRATLFEALVSSEVPRIRALLPDLPAPLGAAIERAMSRSSEERYKDGRDLHAALLDATERAALRPADALESFWRPLVERAARAR